MKKGTLSDDGVRLWLNGEKLIDNWTNHGETLDTSEKVQIDMISKHTHHLLTKLTLPAALLACVGMMPATHKNSIQIIFDRQKQAHRGSTVWNGTNDLSASILISMNDEAIQITIHVVDDVLFTGGKKPYMRDSIEIYMDVRPEEYRGDAYYDRGVFQMILVPPNGETDAQVTWHFEGDESLKHSVVGAEIISKETASGYDFSIRFPLRGFDKNHFIPEKTFNLAIGINDRDNEEETCVKFLNVEARDNWIDPSGFARISFK